MVEDKYCTCVTTVLICPFPVREKFDAVGDSKKPMISHVCISSRMLTDTTTANITAVENKGAGSIITLMATAAIMDMLYWDANATQNCQNQCGYTQKLEKTGVKVIYKGQSARPRRS